MKKNPAHGQVTAIDVTLRGFALITYALLNKGTAFTPEEREAFDLIGLLPPSLTTLPIQRDRSYKAFQSKVAEIEKYIYLRDLQDSNETLFYSLLLERIQELMPIVYTPTVGLGCQRYSHIYRRPRGVFISYPDRFNIKKILANSRFDRTQVIVVSDGERILGLGDQGAGGMGIPIGKLALYTACAGIHPSHTLPILLDTGTNNPELQHDPLYIGWQHERIRGKEYDEFVALFVAAVKERFPHVLLQWEDFAQANANPLLERYRNQLCSFNDDIQGTAAIAAGTLLSAIHVSGIPLRDQRIVVLGAGSAGCGISQLLCAMMVRDGLSEKDAKQRFFLVDQFGLIRENTSNLLSFQKSFAQPSSLSSNTLQEVVEYAHPTLLIGVSGQPGAFNEAVIRKMASFVERPIIFPLSNPTSRCEAHPADLFKWTDGRAIAGTGSPFGTVQKNGAPWAVDQTNNCYIFPGIGLGLIAVKARLVSDDMFIVAAEALADCSPAKANPQANLLPPLADIRQVSQKVALAVAKQAIKEGLASIDSHDDLEKIIADTMWVPEYVPYRAV